MNDWLGNVIAAFSPEAAYRRESYRQAYLELKSYYDAADRTGVNQNWRAMNTSAEYTDRYSRDDVRARARDLERNSDIMNSVVGPFRRNVVGGGYQVQAKTKDPELNKKIEKAWRKWCKKRNCDVTGTQSFNQIMRMAVERKKIDGGILFVKRYTSEGVVPFQLQMIEVDELDLTIMQARNADNKVVGGIEYNSFNKPVGYYIRQYDIDGFTQRDPVYVEAKDVIFYFTKKRPSQLREISDMSHTIQRIRDVNEFMTAVSVKERIAACLAVFIKKAIPTTGMGGVGRSNNAGKQPEHIVSYEGKTISPGMIKEMNAGDEVQVVNPSGQGSDATSYTKLQQRLIGAGQGISYEASSRDMAESTYSSTRQSLIEDNLTYQEDKEQIIEIHDEIYETFIISAVLCGVLDIKDFWNNKDEYLDHEWVQEPKAWIDPQKESNATMTALQTGQKTFKQIAAENGRDWRSQIDDMAEVIQYGQEKGIDMGGILFGKKTEGSAASSKEGDGDESEKKK